MIPLLVPTGCKHVNSLVRMEVAYCPSCGERHSWVNWALGERVPLPIIACALCLRTEGVSCGPCGAQVLISTEPYAQEEQ